LFGNPLLLFIGLFVYLGAAAEAHAVQMRQVARGMVAADAMITDFESLSPTSSINDAVQALIRTTQHEFPVVDGGGRLRGMLTRDAMIRALQQQGRDARTHLSRSRLMPAGPAMRSQGPPALSC
jgi:CBS-domain-containing membrane protein